MKTTPDTIRKVTFSAYVRESEAAHLETQLKNLYSNNVIPIAIGDVTMEHVNIREDMDVASAMAYFNELES